MEVMRVNDENAEAMMKAASCGELDFPIVFPQAVKRHHWQATNWTLESLVADFGHIRSRFRFFRRDAMHSIAWEHHSMYVEDTMANFCSWIQGVGLADETSPLHKVDATQWWGYCDYKHFEELFHGDEEGLQRAHAAVDWKSLGLLGDSHHSTFWFGCGGSYTPCHQDSYGFNFVAQILGEKRWRLYSPSEHSSASMYPTRLPYEESSVFSAVNMHKPDLRTHPKFATAIPYVTVLKPGDVLYVPRKWWHYVTTPTDSLYSLSINTWQDSPLDCRERVKEALVRLVMTSLKTCSGEPRHAWLNPTEEVWTYEQNLSALYTSFVQYLELEGLPCPYRDEEEFGHRAYDALLAEKTVETMLAALLRHV